MIRVVNVRGLNRPAQRAAVCYVGRPFAGWPGHLLANPFKPGRDCTLALCLTLYRRWLAAHPDRDTLLDRLWAECEQGAKPLGCWCCEAGVGGDASDPEPDCHAVVLALELKARFLNSAKDRAREPAPEG